MKFECISRRFCRTAATMFNDSGMFQKVSKFFFGLAQPLYPTQRPITRKTIHRLGHYSVLAEPFCNKIGYYCIRTRKHIVVCVWNSGMGATLGGPQTVSTLLLRNCTTAFHVVSFVCCSTHKVILDLVQLRVSIRVIFSKIS